MTYTKHGLCSISQGRTDIHTKVFVAQGLGIRH